jgi:hypothetical protein
MGADGMAISITTEEDGNLIQRYERDLLITVSPFSL